MSVPHDSCKILLITWMATGCLLFATLCAVADDARNWPHWRGPLATGSSPAGEPPSHWSETENVAWKQALPGKGHSTPVVWGDQVFLTTAIPIGEEMPPRYSDAPGAHDNAPVTHKQAFEVLCLSRSTGQIAWQHRVHEAVPIDGGHFTASFASQSAVTDGQVVLFSFGSYGLYCYSLDGHPLWQKQLGHMRTKHGHGEGSSPYLYGNAIVVNWDHEGESFLVVLHKQTGEELWRAARPEETSWSSPIVVRHAERDVVIVSGTVRIRGYDLTTGDVIWECGGLSSNIVASPVYHDGMLFLGSSYESRALFALQLAGAKGDITDSPHVVWRRTQGTPYVPSPLLYDGTLYYLRHYQGILSRVTAKTGDEDFGPFRLGPIRDVYASPVAAHGHIFVTDRNGVTVVVAHGPVPRLVAANQLDDTFSASAAISGELLLLRGEKHLYALGKP